MTHNHSCSCDHTEVRFCKTCRIIHCLGCNKEWTERFNWTYYTQPWYGSLTYGNTLQQEIPMAKGTAAPYSTSGSNLTAQVKTCDHTE